MSARAATAPCANFSERFDKWSPPSFRLSDADIAAMVAKVPPQTLDDIRFAQAADPQFRRDPARIDARCRGRDAARHRARPSPHPGRQRRLLCARRALSDGRLGAYVDRHGAGRRGRPHRRLHAAEPGHAAPGDDRGDAPRRRRRDLCPRRRPGGRGDGARHRDVPPGGHAGRTRQRLCRRGQAPALRQGRHRSVRRPDRDPRHRRRYRPMPRCARPTCWARPSTARPRRRSC